jgi:hypothetical protein
LKGINSANMQNSGFFGNSQGGGGGVKIDGKGYNFGDKKYKIRG